MTLQYLETLKQIGTSPSTKFVIPVELTNMLAGIVGNNGVNSGRGVRSGNGATSPASITGASADH